jgi:hydroxypyruvate isomerase
MEERDGSVSLLEASSKACNILSRFVVPKKSALRKPAGGLWTPPVVANGRLFLRIRSWSSATMSAREMNREDTMADLSRRMLLQGAAGSGDRRNGGRARDGRRRPGFKIKNGRIRQSIMGWTFNPMPTEELARHCRDLGMHAMEGVDAKHYPMIRELGLKIALTGSHAFQKGPCDPANKEMCSAKIREGIDKAVEFGARTSSPSPDAREGPDATSRWTATASTSGSRSPATPRRRAVNICLEHLNSPRRLSPMKGHPATFGDHVAALRRPHQGRGLAADEAALRHLPRPDHGRRRHPPHPPVQGRDQPTYHTAGVPGRGELDETQELNYPRSSARSSRRASRASWPRSSSRPGRTASRRCATRSASATCEDKSRIANRE